MFIMEIVDEIKDEGMNDKRYMDIMNQLMKLHKADPHSLPDESDETDFLPRNNIINYGRSGTEGGAWSPASSPQLTLDQLETTLGVPMRSAQNPARVRLGRRGVWDVGAILAAVERAGAPALIGRVRDVDIVRQVTLDRDDNIIHNTLLSRPRRHAVHDLRLFMTT